MARSSPAEGRRGRHGIQIDTTDSDQKSEHYPPVIGDPRSANRTPVVGHVKTIRITKIIIDQVERIKVEPATDHEEELGFSERSLTITDEKGDIYEIVLEAFSK